jgi:hypothetical protein
MKTVVYTLPDATKDVSSNNYLDINKIRFSDTPYKKICKEATLEFKKDTFTHFIDMYYKNNPLVIQLPKTKIKNLDSNKILIEINEEMVTYLIKPLEEYIINTVHENSEKWFSGKKFTMNKIMNSLVSPLTKDTSNSLKLTLTKNTMYFNRYKTMIQYDDIKLSNDDIDIICLVKIANIQFLQNKFSYNLVLEQAKVFMDDRLIEYSIIDDLDGRISESVSENNSCEKEYYQESIDSDNREFF